jgi:hypothetical protein
VEWEDAHVKPWRASRLRCEVQFGKMKTTSLSSVSGWNAVDVQPSRVADGRAATAIRIIGGLEPVVSPRRNLVIIETRIIRP